MKNILITGGAGFIGSNFIHHILNHRSTLHITNLDDLTYSGNLDNLKDIQNLDRYHFIKGNICDPEAINCLFQKYTFDTVVHFAAESHVDRSIQNPMQFIETNVVGTANLLRNALIYWEKLEPGQKRAFRFLHVSTDEVFGSLDAGDPPFSETTPYAPNSPYAASKAASDHLVRSYYQTYHFPAIITNCSNNYGPFQFPEKLIPLIILNAIAGKPLPIYGDGRQVRDWLYVLDHCQALLEILEKGKIGETYNIGGNNQPANLDIVRQICSILDELRPESPFKPHSQLIQFVPDRPGHDRRYAMDTRKIEKEIGWQPRENLESGLEKTVKWYLDHPDWVENIQKKPDYQAWMNVNYSQRGTAKR
jgi:dTDP-glucose 4,6-dehydratase